MTTKKTPPASTGGNGNGTMSTEDNSVATELPYVLFPGTAGAPLEPGRTGKKKNEHLEHARAELSAGRCGAVRMYYDLKAGSYFLINSQDEIIFLKETGAKKTIYDAFGVSGKEAQALMLDVMKVYRVFDPAAPEIEYGSEGEAPTLNMFKPSRYMEIADKTMKDERITELDWDKYPSVRLLLSNVFGDDEAGVMYFVNWLSTIINTRRKTKTAIVLKGSQGAGKGVLFDHVISKAIGEKYCAIVSNEELRSDFNDILDNRLCVAFNEIRADLHERNTVYERLKAYVTDDKIIINGKYRAAVQQPQFFNCVVFSNHEIPLQIEWSDRRYSVFETSLYKLPEVVNREYGDDVTMSEFIGRILPPEVDEFLSDVARFRYDITTAMTARASAAKKRIQESTTTAIIKLISHMREKNVEWLESELAPLAEAKQAAGSLVEWQRLEDFLKEVQENKYTQETLKWLYLIYIGPEQSERKIWQTWTTHISHTYVSNSTRYRSFERTK
ncbi:MAG: primase-helicase family protein [Nitrospirota bacterium]